MRLSLIHKPHLEQIALVLFSLKLDTLDVAPNWLTLSIRKSQNSHIWSDWLVSWLNRQSSFSVLCPRISIYFYNWVKWKIEWLTDKKTWNLLISAILLMFQLLNLIALISPLNLSHTVFAANLRFSLLWHIARERMPRCVSCFCWRWWRTRAGQIKKTRKWASICK